MTLNVRYATKEDLGSRAWPQRLQPIVRAIADERPDIIAIQEALQVQAADLRASLTDYAFFGAAREDGKKLGEYAAIFYRKTRFLADPTKQGTFWLSDHPQRPGSKTWGNTIPRITTWLELVERNTNKRCLIYNTHWDHKHQGSRERAALLLAKHIDQERSPNVPVILLGDFNAVERNPALAYLTGQRVRLAGELIQWDHALIDTYAQLRSLHHDRTTLHFWLGVPNGTLKVDHILVSSPVQILEAAIRTQDRPLLSDHFPVTSHLIFPPS